VHCDLLPVTIIGTNLKEVVFGSSSWEFKTRCTWRELKYWSNCCCYFSTDSRYFTRWQHFL